jgi:hypothetical protein
MDITRGIFQQLTHEEDQWKPAFVTPHRGREMFNCVHYENSEFPWLLSTPDEEVLAECLWKLVLACVDDIIVFSQTLEEHLHHLNCILSIP